MAITFNHNDKLYVNDSNVGIGTTSPAKKLEVNGASSYPDIRISATGLTSRYMEFGMDSAVQHSIGAFGTGSYLTFKTAGTDKVVIDASGNVGIGTTSPGAKLNVAGNAIIGDGVSRATSGLTVGYSRSTAYTANSDLGDANRAVTIINNQDNTANTYATLGFRVSPNTSTSMGDFKFVRTAANENSLIWTARHGTSWYDRFTIKSDGNVGIGTTSPVHKLHVDSGSIQLRDKVFYSASGNDTGSGTANGFAATLNDYHGTTLESQWTYKISITTTGTGTYNSSSYIVYRNSADTAWVSREISRSGTSSNHPELTISGNNAIIYDDHTSTYTVRYTVESRYTGQSKTSPHIMGSDYHWQRTGSDLYYTDGNVGIGTSSPTYKFEVSNGTQTGTFNPNSSGFMWLGSTSNHPLYFGVNDSTKVAVLSSGNVGIGTTSPQALLDVRGKAKVGNGAESSDNDFPFTVAHDNYRTDAYGSTMLVRDNRAYNSTNNGGGILFGGLFNSTNGVSWWGKIKTTKDNTNDGDYAAHMSFFTRANGVGPAERMRITSDGNVGIGTTSPAYKLHVEGNVGITEYLQHSGDNNTYLRFSTDLIRLAAGGVEMIRLLEDATQDAVVINEGGADVDFRVESDTDTHALFLQGSSGRIGIGTSSPPSTVLFDLKENTSAADLIIGLTAATGGRSQIRSVAQADNTTSEISFHTVASSSTSEAMRIASNGNVGIGTTSPSSKLQVVGNVSASGFTSDNIYGATYPSNSFIRFDDDQTASSNNVSIGSIGRINYLGDTNGNHPSADPVHQFFTGTTDIDTATALMTITAGGNVGIGTTSPDQKLQIHESSSQGVYLKVTNSTTGENGGNGALFGINTNEETLVWNYENTATRFSTNGTERMRIANNGRVGIGTTNPTAILTLTGTLNDNWAGRFENTNTGGYGMLVITAGSTDNERVFEARCNTSTSILMVKANGKVGINDSTPSYTLDVNGTIHATGDVISFSDARVKENVETVSNALDKVKAMRGVGYNKIGSEKRSVGVIAQEMLEVLPEVVHQDSDGMYSVAYGNLVGVLIEAMKEQQAQIDELKAMLNTDA